MRIRLLLLGLLFLCQQAMTQNRFGYLGDEYLDDIYLGISASYSFVRNVEAPHPEDHSLNGFTASIDLRRTSWDVGDRKYMMKYKLLADVFLIVENQINSDGSQYYRSQESFITNGLLGWHSWAWGIFANEKISLGLGLNLNDYFIGTSYYNDTTKKLYSPEPSGYHFAAGPNFMLDYIMNKFVMFHFQSAYSISYYRFVTMSYAIKDDSYPKPHFFQFSLEAQSPWGFYLAADFNGLINRGDLPAKTRRLDLLFGFKFVL